MLDFETYSEAGYMPASGGKWKPVQRNKSGIETVGLVNYFGHPSARVLSLAYELDGRDHIWVPGPVRPVDLYDYVRSGGVLKAWNSLFEWYAWNVLLTEYGAPPLPLEQIEDIMPRARYWGLPGKLAAVCQVLKPAVTKLDSGTALIKQFSIPPYVAPSDDPKRFSDMLHYNLVDVQTESALDKMLPDLSPLEHAIWSMDQRINTRGVAVDMRGLEACLRTVQEATGPALAEFESVTGIDSVDKNKQFAEWLTRNGVETKSVAEEAITEISERPGLPEQVVRALGLWGDLKYASVKKLDAIRHRVASDGRLYGLYQYYGARPGRWSARGPQPHNLPRTIFTADQMDAILGLMAQGGAAAIAPLGPPLKIVSMCLRGLFTASTGQDLVCSDYNAIEARDLSIQAGEQWRIDVFRSHGKIYEATGSRITGVPFEQIDKSHFARKIGKVTELAFGYQGSVGAALKFGARDTIGGDEDILAVVRQWRAANPQIVQLWYGLEDAWRMAYEFPGREYGYNSAVFAVHGGVMYSRLPSGRSLAYQRPGRVERVSRGPDGRPTGTVDIRDWDGKIYGAVVRKSAAKEGTLVYWGSEAGTYRCIDIYGGKLTENLTQARCRDYMAWGMLQAEARGYPIVMHTHDEPVAEIPHGFGSVEEFESIISQPPPWCPEFPLVASDGWRGRRYRK